MLLNTACSALSVFAPDAATAASAEAGRPALSPWRRDDATACKGRAHAPWTSCRALCASASKLRSASTRASCEPTGPNWAKPLSTCGRIAQERLAKLAALCSSSTSSDVASPPASAAARALAADPAAVAFSCGKRLLLPVVCRSASRSTRCCVALRKRSGSRGWVIASARVRSKSLSRMLCTLK
jgi:hypothetical protein